MRDPTAELLAAMANDGLHPKQIIWDSSFHRFPGVDQKGRGDNGFYRAFVDQRGAIYGDNRTGLRIKWAMEGLKKLTSEEREDLKLRQAEAEKQREQDAEAAQKRVDTKWGQGTPCENHPYLDGKGIKDVAGLASVPDSDTGEPILMIPMYGTERKLENIQRIWPDGTRKQMKGVRKTGLFNTIVGTELDTKRMHVCEGFATGHSVHLATEGTVAVAFFDGGLKPVSAALRKKYPDAEIIICADNDRWSRVWRGKKQVWNPGVVAAREAAAASGADLCIPDFADLSDVPPDEKGPTDFDDLRQREGLDAVRKWLDPKMAKKAVTIVGEPEPPQPGGPAPDAEHWSDHFPSRCLGAIGKTHYFIPNNFGQLIELAQREMTSNNLYSLARKVWYEEHFPDKKGVDWNSCVDEIISYSQSLGPYQPGKLCGRGVWRTDDGLIVHLGDRMLAPGKKRFISPAEYKGGNRIYATGERLDGPHPKRTLPPKTCHWLIQVFEDLLWEQPTSAYLLAGWTVMAPFSGYLRWRPHVWVTGDAGCGKTTILRDLVVPLTAGMSLYAEGSVTSEPGLRQEMGADALPVILDEPEKDEKTAAKRIGVIVRMMRSASATAAKSYKGTPSGKALSWESRSMFCLGSVGGAVSGKQDRQRISLLQLQHPLRTWGSVDKRETHYKGLLAKLSRITPTLSRQLVGRTLEWARDGRLDELLETSIAAATTVLGDRRSGDQYGTLLAGAALLLNDDMPTEEDMIAWMKDLALEHFVDIEGTDPEGQHILEGLFQVQETVPVPGAGTLKVTVGEMVSLVIRSSILAQPPGSMKIKEAEKYLKDIGFIVREGNLFVANRSVWTRKHVPPAYADSWPNLLRTMPGAQRGEGQMWFTGRNSRTTRIPVSLLPLEPGPDDPPGFIPPQ